MTQTATPAAPSIVTQNSDVATQTMLMQAMLQSLPQQQQGPIAAALALQARKAANVAYLKNGMRKIGPTLTNGQPTQAYALNVPMTFNLDTALNAYIEGIIVRISCNYTLATGTSAVYGNTAAGGLGIIDMIFVNYNKTQIKMRPQALRQLALQDALAEKMIPEGVLVGQEDAYLQAYLNTPLATTVGTQTVTYEFYLPFNLISPYDPRGVLPLMQGDTGIQVVVNTPLAWLGSDAIINSLYAVSGSGHACTVNSGTVAVEAVYKDGDTYMQTEKLPYDISVVDGTFQMQIDQTLQPLVPNAVQRTKLNVMGQHYYILLCVVDAVSPAKYSSWSNITYIESAKDGIGGNTFWKYGAQTNMDFREYLYLNRLAGRQDIDEGIIPMIQAPVTGNQIPSERAGRAFLDNTRTGWSDWRYGIQVAAVGTNGSGPRIEPWIFYVNPAGLQSV